MSSQNVDRDQIESWTAPRSAHVASGPERDCWLAFGQLVDAHVPTSDNERLIDRINEEIRSKNISRPGTKRFLRIAEPIAAISAIAAMVAITVLWNRPAGNLRSLNKHEIRAANVTPWNDDLANPIHAAETATMDLAVEFSRAMPIDRDFNLIEQALSNLAEDLDQGHL